MDALNRAGLSGPVDLARANPQAYGRSFQEALKNGASYDQALKRATADAAMKVAGKQVPIDTLLNNIGGDPKKAVSAIEGALEQAGIRMTPGELNWLRLVAAEASILQEDATFQQKVAVEMLDGKTREEAWTAASEKLWQEATDKVIALGISGFDLEGKEGQSQQTMDAIDGRESLDDGALTNPGETDGSLTDEQAPVPEAFSQQEDIGMEETGAEQAKEKRFQDLLEKAKRGDIIEFDDELEDIVASKSFEELTPLIEKLPNRAARKWYIAQNNLIPSQIDRSLDLEGQARQGFDLRNQNKLRTRDLMLDQEARRGLDITDPIQTFEEMLSYKKSKGMDQTEALEDILRTVTKTRKSVNEGLGLE